MLEAILGSGWQSLDICAASLDGQSYDHGKAVFSESLAHGLLRAEPETVADGENGELAINLTSNQSSTQLCGRIFFWPRSPGFEVVAFEVQAVAGSSRWLANGTLHVNVKENRPPVAGTAMALKTDGKEGYALLAGQHIPDEFTVAFWIKPDAVTDDSYILSRHLVSGSNVFMFGFWSFSYYFSLRCYQSCNGGQLAVGRAFIPGGEAGDMVMDTGETVAQVREGRIQPHHVTLTFRCISRGNATHPAQARVTFFRNGQLLYDSSDFGACPDLESAYSDDLQPTDGRLAPLTPWEVGSEYDSGPWDAHLPGMAVLPSNFMRAAFDDIRLYSVELIPTEISRILASDFVDRDSALLFHYTFDTDDERSCRYRQLLSTNAASFSCFMLNDRGDRVDGEFLQRFPYMNSVIGPVQHIPSPFQSRGADIHHSMQELTCAEVPLRASDVDGDLLTFHLVHPETGATLVSQNTATPSVRFCDTVGTRRDVEVVFDVCDAPGLCASQFTGLGKVIVHVFAKGPQVLAFQHLPDTAQLRLVFSEPTNMAPVTGDHLMELLVFTGSPPLLASDVLDSVWEQGGQGLRLLLRSETSANLSEARGRGAASMVVDLKAEGYLRDRNETTFFTYGTGPPLQEVRCLPGTALLPGERDCRGCGLGFFLDPEEPDGQCKPCRPGYFAATGAVQECLPCARGTWQSAAGSSLCHNCTSFILGSTTSEMASTYAAACVCPEKTALIQGDRGGPECSACGEGLECPEGVGVPFQSRGFFAREVLLNSSDSSDSPVLVAMPRLVKCAVGKCLGGLELGTCPLLQDGLACSHCVRGHKWDGQQCAECSAHNNLALMGLGMVCLILSVGLARRITQQPVFSQTTETLAAYVTILANMMQALGAVADLPLQLEQDSLWAVLELLKWFSLSADILDLSCVYSGGASMSYLFAVLVQPAMITLVVVTSYLRALLVKINWALVFSNVGTLMLLLFLSSARLALLPLQCADNPDGSSSVLTYRSTLCWESGEHVAMVASSFASALFFIAGPVSAVAWAVRVYPQRLQRPGGVQFMLAWRFAFDRFSAECYGYSVIFLLRNLMVAAIPMIFVNSPRAMVFLLNLVLVCGMAVQVRLFPWRNYYANFVDAAGLL